MSRRFGLSVLTMVLMIGLTVSADEKPTMEHQTLMRSNAALIGAMGLRGHALAKDYAAIGKDAAMLRENFKKVEAFWTPRKVEDAINFAKAGIKAAADLEAAAKAKNDSEITVARRAVASTCEGCHQAHRLVIVTENRFEIMSAR